MKKTVAGKAPVYQLKITLRDSKPPIWRRILVPGHATLFDLHHIIQIAMGWGNSHLHQFVIGRVFYTVPSDEDSMRDEPDRDESEYVLAEVAPTSGRKFLYEYDFGDGWEHDILVEKILNHDPALRTARCLAGKLACPPDDCGGMYGYYDKLRIAADENDPDHDDIVGWLGEDFDPDKFDMDEVNNIFDGKIRPFFAMD
jgi:hypothetical protein